ncbi:FAD-dependent oxidoreductase [Saccharopolyspora shandongensis]|uniref:NAD(P)/FAD-dependent oxidoreductase n=1 Tax=Saccharopolyspora shandongensis TaxID=418495 RepID=UPI0034414868
MSGESVTRPVGRLVVVGAGQAGVHVVSALRRSGHDGDVTLIGGEDHLPYQRPPLSKAFLKEPHPAHIVFHRAEHYDSIGVRLLCGDPARGIDRDHGLVVLESGVEVPYDHLVLATGSRPRMLDELSSAGNVFTVHGWNDSCRLHERLGGARSMLLIGGGFIGLEVATVASELGCEVTVVEQATRVLGHMLPPLVADFLAGRHAESGVKFRFEETIKAFEFGANGDVRSATTSSGARVDADVVVVGIGSQPQVDLAERAGLDTADGIIVDEHLTTSDPRISAVGDCIRFPVGSRSCRLTSVQHATDSAQYLAKALLGTRPGYDPVPWFWTDQAGVKVQITGMPGRSADRSELIGDVSTGRFAVWRYDGDEFIGGEAVGMPREHLKMRRELAETRRSSRATG